ncbi:hypothetical protein [Streptomyces prunicolor]|uniref:hypothetical protein n=1 Tax=Streptomyces prunicolor TaxID=67348 RepID=UPI00036489FB|nr:hypothetical protein [Streptomyces prunicolor]
MAIDVFDAVRLAKTNRRRDRRLLECQEELDQRAVDENAALQKARQTLFDEALLPFRDAFQRLKRVDLVELAAIERPTAGGEVGIGPRQPRKSAVTVAAVSALAGGALLVVGGPPLVGYVAEAGAYRAVRTFGSASTGRAIKRLSGAAARNATEAWFGRGPVAAGGGGRAAGKRVLSEIHATSANLTRKTIVKWQIQTLGDGEREKARDLDRRETAMSEAQDAASALHERSRDMQRVLQDLQFTLVRRLPSFTTLVEACDDLARYDSRRRAEVATMVDLDGLAVMVMNCPIIDAEERMTEGSGRVIAAAEARLRAMETE